MDRYIHEQNLALYRTRLGETQDATQREVLLRLIADEMAKALPPRPATGIWRQDLAPAPEARMQSRDS